MKRLAFLVSFYRDTRPPTTKGRYLRRCREECLTGRIVEGRRYRRHNPSRRCTLWKLARKPCEESSEGVLIDEIDDVVLELHLAVRMRP